MSAPLWSITSGQTVGIGDVVAMDAITEGVITESSGSNQLRIKVVKGPKIGQFIVAGPADIQRRLMRSDEA